MIEVKLKDILNIEILNEISTKKFKARAAYHFARIMRAINEEYDLFQKEREKLINKYGAKDENGQLIIANDGTITIDKQNIENFNREINELIETNIQLNVELLNLEDIEDEYFTPQQMNILSLFIKN